MYKIAILGCENSHADRFLQLIYKDKLYPDIEVIGVYSDYPEAAEKTSNEYGLYAAKSYDEFVGKVDGIVVTARHGGSHYKFAKPYIPSKIPMYIDKPITVTEEDAEEFRKELEENNIKVTGGTVCIHDDKVQEFKKYVAEKTYGPVYGGYLRAPVSMKNAHGDFFFYSQHLVQTTCEIFGYNPKSVIAFQNGIVITCTLRYKDYDVNFTFTDQINNYYAGINCEQKLVVEEYFLKGCIAKEFKAYYDILTGKEQTVTYKDFFAPVYIMNAIHRSLQSGKEEIIKGC